MGQDLSYSTYDSKKKTHMTKQSRETTYKSSDNENITNAITGYEYDLGDRLERLERLEREAGMQAQQIELNEYIEFVAQLVDLYKRTAITVELQSQNDWHNDTRQHQEQHKSATGGLTKEQWNCLLYMLLSTDDMVELSKISKNYLKKVRDKALRLLEDNEKSAVFALINAIEKCVSKIYFTGK
ncbi:unnamed protein product [Rotaria magnacalcarata]|uniref:Uncharacterized protein n=1 Tax=Rotaria magnacalcarata TaxID=392030 RepID=A0A818Y0J1_9BILA|nr:unnamed protein product [Rotaria magnacalcarata]